MARHFLIQRVLETTSAISTAGKLYAETTRPSHALAGLRVDDSMRADFLSCRQGKGIFADAKP